MKVLTPGQAANYLATISATVASGATLTSVDYKVVDYDGTIVQASRPGTVTSPSGGVSLTLDILTNTLPPGESKAIRQIQMTLGYSDSTVQTAKVNYLIRGDSLALGVNSFVTALEAELIAVDIHDIAVFTAASDDDKRTALILARDDLCRLQFAFNADLDPLDQSHLNDEWGWGGVARLKNWSAQDITTLPAAFLVSLKKAQVIQAAYRLGAFPEEAAAESGVFSRTVGESSQMFRPGMKPITYPVCKRALAALHGYTTTAKWSIARG